MIDVLLRVVVDDDGNLFFTDAVNDKEWLRDRPAGWVAKAFTAAMDVNSLTKAGIDEQKKS